MLTMRKCFFGVKKYSNYLRSACFACKFLFTVLPLGIKLLAEGHI